VSLVQSDTWVFRHPVTSNTTIYGPKVFLLTKIKPEYSIILYTSDVKHRRPKPSLLNLVSCLFTISMLYDNWGLLWSNHFEYQEVFVKIDVFSIWRFSHFSIHNYKVGYSRTCLIRHQGTSKKNKTPIRILTIFDRW
jgi:hypothetical protein